MELYRYEIQNISLLRKNIIELLTNLKKESLRGNDAIAMRVSSPFKKLYSLYVRSGTAAEHHINLMRIRQLVLSTILQDIMSYSELQLDTNILKELDLEDKFNPNQITGKLIKTKRKPLQREKIIELLEQLKNEGIIGQSLIHILVSDSFKKLYDVYLYIGTNGIEERRNKIMKIRRLILSFILQELMSYPELQLDANILKELGLESTNNSNGDKQ